VQANSTESVLAKEYIINGEIIDIGDKETLTDKIRRAVLSAKEANYKEFHVEIRADHCVKFEAVQDVLKAAAVAHIRGINMKMNITAAD
jgi:biopolymer transport protein ExbD